MTWKSTFYCTKTLYKLKKQEFLAIADDFWHENDKKLLIFHHVLIKTNQNQSKPTLVDNQHPLLQLITKNKFKKVFKLFTINKNLLIVIIIYKNCQILKNFHG